MSNEINKNKKLRPNVNTSTNQLNQIKILIESLTKNNVMNGNQNQITENNCGNYINNNQLSNKNDEERDKTIGNNKVKQEITNFKQEKEKLKNVKIIIGRDLVILKTNKSKKINDKAFYSGILKSCQSKTIKQKTNFQDKKDNNLSVNITSKSDLSNHFDDTKDIVLAAHWKQNSSTNKFCKDSSLTCNISHITNCNVKKNCSSENKRQLKKTIQMKDNSQNSVEVVKLCSLSHGERKANYKNTTKNANEITKVQHCYTKNPSNKVQKSEWKDKSNQINPDFQPAIDHTEKKITRSTERKNWLGNIIGENKLKLEDKKIETEKTVLSEDYKNICESFLKIIKSQDEKSCLGRKRSYTLINGKKVDQFNDEDIQRYIKDFLFRKYLANKIHNVNNFLQNKKGEINNKAARNKENISQKELRPEARYQQDYQSVTGSKGIDTDKKNKENKYILQESFSNETYIIPNKNINKTNKYLSKNTRDKKEKSGSRLNPNLREQKRINYSSINKNQENDISYLKKSSKNIALKKYLNFKKSLSNPKPMKEMIDRDDFYEFIPTRKVFTSKHPERKNETISKIPISSNSLNNSKKNNNLNKSILVQNDEICIKKSKIGNNTYNNNDYNINNHNKFIYNIMSTNCSIERNKKEKELQAEHGAIQNTDLTNNFTDETKIVNVIKSKSDSELILKAIKTGSTEFFRNVISITSSIYKLFKMEYVAGIKFLPEIYHVLWKFHSLTKTLLIESNVGHSEIINYTDILQNNNTLVQEPNLGRIETINCNKILKKINNYESSNDWDSSEECVRASTDDFKIDQLLLEDETSVAVDSETKLQRNNAEPNSAKELLNRAEKRQIHNTIVDTHEYRKTFSKVKETYNEIRSLKEENIDCTFQKLNQNDIEKGSTLVNMCDIRYSSEIREIGFKNGTKILKKSVHTETTRKNLQNVKATKTINLKQQTSHNNYELGREEDNSTECKNQNSKGTSVKSTNVIQQEQNNKKLRQITNKNTIHSSSTLTSNKSFLDEVSDIKANQSNQIFSQKTKPDQSKKSCNSNNLFSQKKCKNKRKNNKINVKSNKDGSKSGNTNEPKESENLVVNEKDNCGILLQNLDDGVYSPDALNSYKKITIITRTNFKSPSNLCWTGMKYYGRETLSTDKIPEKKKGVIHWVRSWFE